MPFVPSREFSSLVQRVARYPNGLEFLGEGYLESVAITLGVHPFVVDAARGYLNTPAGRAELDRAVGDEASAESGEVDPSGDERDPIRMPDSPEAEVLIVRARADARGIECLCDGDPEAIAAAFGVHPYVVFRARGVLEREALCRRAQLEVASKHEKSETNVAVTKSIEE